MSTLRALVLVFALPFALLFSPAANAGIFDALLQRPSGEPGMVVAKIDISTQTMLLSVDGTTRASWPVSTAGQGYHTPRGVFRVQRMAAVWFSRKYDNSPMPHSVFFDGGVAIHGSYHIRSLGRAVSHGCVRLAPEHAAEFFALVKQWGPKRTKIIVTD